MPIQQIMIDGDVADKGKELANAQGFSSLDYYIMHLINKEYDEAVRSAIAQKAIEADINQNLDLPNNG